MITKSEITKLIAKARKMEKADKSRNPCKFSHALNKVTAKLSMDDAMAVMWAVHEASKGKKHADKI